MGNVARIMRHDYAEVERGRVSLHIESRFQGHKFCLNYPFAHGTHVVWLQFACFPGVVFFLFLKIKITSRHV